MSEPNRKRRRSGQVRRLLTLLAFLPVASRAPDYLRLIWALVEDDRVSTSRKALLAAALAYVAIPFDIIPDDVPVLGAFDDVVVAVLAIDTFFDGIPVEVMDDQLSRLGIDRAAYERDLSQIGQMTPRPIRRVARRIPRAIDAAVGAVRATGAVPRVRRWINKEGSFA